MLERYRDSISGDGALEAPGYHQPEDQEEQQKAGNGEGQLAENGIAAGHQRHDEDHDERAER